MFWVSNRNTSLIDLMRGYIGCERSHHPKYTARVVPRG